jgi:hypothetical protein
MINKWAAVGRMRLGRVNCNTWRKSILVLLCPPKISHDLIWDRFQAAAMGSQWLMVRVIARPYYNSNNLIAVLSPSVYNTYLFLTKVLLKLVLLEYIIYPTTFGLATVKQKKARWHYNFKRCLGFCIVNEAMFSRGLPTSMPGALNCWVKRVGNKNISEKEFQITKIINA